MDSTPLTFDSLAPQEVPVTIGEDRYLLREPTEDAVRNWRNAIARTVRVHDGKPAGLDGVWDTDSLLVSYCLWKVRDDGALDKLRVEVVRSWPSRIVQRLFAEAKRLGGLDRTAEETRADAKNLPANGEVTSTSAESSASNSTS